MLSPAKFLCFTALSLSLALTGTTEAAVIKIATVSPLSGDTKTIGNEFKRGAELAIKQYENQFKAMGHEIQLVSFDDQANATHAATITKPIVDDAAILGVVGAYNTSVANVIAPVFQNSNLALLTTSSNDLLTTKGWTIYNRLVGPNRAEALAAAQYISDEIKPKNAFVITDNTTYGNGLAKRVNEQLLKLKVKIEGYQGASDDTQIAAVVKKIKSADVDLVYFGGTDAVGSDVVKALRAGGYSGPILGGAGLDSPAFIKNAGASANNVIYSTIFGPLDAFNASTLFSRMYQMQYKTKGSGVAAYAYDGASALLQAILSNTKGNDLPSRAEVAQAVRKTDIKACGASAITCTVLTGPVAFDNTGEREQSRVFIMKFNNSAKPDLLKVQNINAANLSQP